MKIKRNAFIKGYFGGFGIKYVCDVNNPPAIWWRLPLMNRSGFYRSYLWKRSFKEWLLGHKIENKAEKLRREERFNQSRSL